MVSAAPPALDRTRLDPRSVAAWIAAVGVGVIALGLCLWRLLPGLGFWDTAEFQMVLPVMGTAHPTGYPTYVLLGWLANILLTPLGEESLRMNVLSAILVAVGAAVSVDLARRLSGSLALGLVAGLGATLTPIIWAIGTHADPHALHYTLIALMLWLLVRWEHGLRGNPVDPDDGPMRAPAARTRVDRLLIAAAVVTGLSVGNHSLTLLFGPAILAFVLVVAPGILRRPRLVVACIAAFAIPTVLVRFELVLRAGWSRAPFVYADPSTWEGFWYVTLGQQFHDWMTNPLADWPKRMSDLATIAAGQLGPLAPLVVVAFAVTLVRQPRYALLTGITMGITLFFNSVYPDGAIDRYYIVPALIAWTWLAILGATIVDVVTGEQLAWEEPDGDVGPDDSGPPVRRDIPRRDLLRRNLFRPVGMALAGAVLIAPSLLAFPVRARDVDRTGDRAAERWTDEVLSALAPNAVVISWWSYSTPLWYATIVDGRRTDICIIDDRNRLDYALGDLDQVIDRYIDTRPVYLIRNGSSELGALDGRYTIVPLGAPTATNVLHVTARTGTPATPAAATGEPCR